MTYVVGHILNHIILQLKNNVRTRIREEGNVGGGFVNVVL